LEEFQTPVNVELDWKFRIALEDWMKRLIGYKFRKFQKLCADRDKTLLNMQRDMEAMTKNNPPKHVTQKQAIPYRKDQEALDKAQKEVDKKNQLLTYSGAHKLIVIGSNLSPKN